MDFKALKQKTWILYILIILVLFSVTHTFRYFKAAAPSWANAGVGSFRRPSANWKFDAKPWTATFNEVAEALHHRPSRRATALLRQRAHILEATSSIQWTKKTVVVARLPDVPIWFLNIGMQRFGNVTTMGKISTHTGTTTKTTPMFWSPSACNIPCVFTDAVDIVGSNDQERFKVDGFVQMLDHFDVVERRSHHAQQNSEGKISRAWIEGEEPTGNAIEDEAGYTLPVISMTWEAKVPVRYQSAHVSASSIYAGPLHATGG